MYLQKYIPKYISSVASQALHAIKCLKYYYTIAFKSLMSKYWQTTIQSQLLWVCLLILL